MRKVYNPLGFSKGYNFVLWFIFDLALFGFVLSRLQYLSFNDVFCGPGHSATSHAGPGECYWYRGFRVNNIGIILHLAGILPGSFLAVFQFIPLIRHKVILYHRIAGYVIFALIAVAQAGAIMVANHAFGGDAATQSYVGVLVILTTASLALAYYNVKRLQIDQHRAWMLRAWFYFGTIITLRLVSLVATRINEIWPAAQQHLALSCAEIINIYAGATPPVYALYPACNPLNAAFSDGGWVAVTANFGSKDPAAIAASLDSYFGMSGWIAFVLHAPAVEVYLKLTPREGQRLRQVSYERQMERGMKHAGSAGLTVDRLGDSDPWVPNATSEKRPGAETLAHGEVDLAPQ